MALGYNSADIVFGNSSCDLTITEHADDSGNDADVER